MDRLPEGALMQRAATGLAVAIADLLGSTYAARVLLLVGAGDNGGDALWAGAMLARRGVSVEAVLLSSKVHVDGLAALRAAGGRTVSVADAQAARRASSTGSSASAADRACATRPRRRSVASRECRSWRWTSRQVWTWTPGALDGGHVRADLTVTFGTHKIAHLVDPAAQACGVVHLVDIGLRAAGGAGGGAAAGRRRGDVAGAVGVRAQVHPRGRRGPRRLGDLSRALPCCAPRAQRPGSPGWSATWAPPATQCVRGIPEVVTADGRVQAWVVGSGGDADAEDALAEALADGGADRRRR